ncbi:MAG TPA: hypothetical protein VNX88_19675 [Terriglobales bacterium]|jgi:hypothetical protein|nr:hypothetical protein [Terriglobales bacterium]
MKLEAAIREVLRIRRRSIVQFSVARKPDDSVALILVADGSEFHFPIKGNRIEDCSGNVYGKADEWQKVDFDAACERNNAKYNTAPVKTRKAS